MCALRELRSFTADSQICRGSGLAPASWFYLLSSSSAWGVSIAQPRGSTPQRCFLQEGEAALQDAAAGNWTVVFLGD